MPRTAHSRQSLASQLQRVQEQLDQLRDRIASLDLTLGVEEVSADWLRGILQARRRREAAFPDGIFSDPAWDILLALYAAALAQEETRPTDLCRYGNLPLTTVLRWAERLEREGLVVRINDDADRRQVFIRLSEQGAARMEEFFRQPQTGVAV